MRVEIAVVTVGPPAEAPGLQAGDAIVGVAGNSTATLDDVQRATRSNAGQTVPFNIERDGQELSIPVTLRSSWPSGAGPLGVQLHGQALDTRPVSYPLRAALAQRWEL